MNGTIFTPEELKEIITLLTEAEDANRVNTYSKNRIKKAINKLNK